MSWMWPSYVLQTKFDHTWTPLARRYSLWLYREANRESHEVRATPKWRVVKILTKFQ